ncbi:unnamed protein product [Rotaria sp. Silwood1]|nr:unnamed protein product [Rotaria sp. Silwood1]CAF1620484.1 unnamed protein product [Rotaria sp. Silwood1]
MATSGEGKEFEYRILRLTDIANEPLKLLAPIHGYENMPLVSLEEAVAPLISLVPDIQNYASLAKQRCSEPADGLTQDESAAIMLYSMGWEPLDQCLYVALNAALRSPDRQHLKPWFLFLKLFLTAFVRLPPNPHHIVYRGVKLDLHRHYNKGQKVVWWGFSSCTTSIKFLEAEQIFGKTGSRTIFCIECNSGKDIRAHSYYSTEDEILLLPATQFEVVACFDHALELHIIHLKETRPPFSLLKPIPSAISQKEAAVCKQSINEICTHFKLFY